MRVKMGAVVDVAAVMGAHVQLLADKIVHVKRVKIKNYNKNNRSKSSVSQEVTDDFFIGYVVY